MEFEAFKKIPRLRQLNNRVVITEKLDGTNAQVAFDDNMVMRAGSRNRWLEPEGVGPKGCDNFGFAAWCKANEEELRKLGPGRHFGEWYGAGIGPRKYGLSDRRFALFNVGRWARAEAAEHGRPACCEVVSVLYEGENTGLRDRVETILSELRDHGSAHVPGFMNPEGVVIYLPGFDSLAKALCEGEGAKSHPSAIEVKS